MSARQALRMHEAAANDARSNEWGYAGRNRERVTAEQPLVFQNAGLIDMAAVTTMGISVKDGDSPIGYFGTGLKFAIATILRNGGSVTIWRGLDQYDFGTERDEVRGQPFDFVTMNGQRLGFTTQLGRTWERWMAFRELASNCRDEGGEYFRSVQCDWTPLDGYTTIAATGLNEVWPDRDSIFVATDPICSNKHAEVHPGPSMYVYYRGVRVHALSRPSFYRYNINETLELTEDRTAANPWAVDLQIERCIGALTETQMLRDVLTCGETYSEHHMDVPKWGRPGDAFRAVSRELALGAARELNVNPAAAAFARKSAMDDAKPGHSVTLDPVKQRMLDRATKMLSAGGFGIEAFPVTVVDSLGPSICGSAHNGKIFLSLLAFEKGTREVAATLLEEFAHLRSGASDCTRQFQNWLFDQLLAHVEQSAREPF